jgi:hypothetical protein
MHKKNLTTDNLASRGMQHNLLCPLCGSHPEDTDHLLIQCPFAKEVIGLLWSWFQLQGTPTSRLSQMDLASCLVANAARANTGDLQLAIVILLYVWWNVWKEQNRWIFDSTQRSEFQVANAAKEEVDLYRRTIHDFHPL